jgi:hypothetical protein
VLTDRVTGCHRGIDGNRHELPVIGAHFVDRIGHALSLPGVTRPRELIAAALIENDFSMTYR